MPRVRYSDPVFEAMSRVTGSEYRTRGTQRNRQVIPGLILTRYNVQRMMLIVIGCWPWTGRRLLYLCTPKEHHHRSVFLMFNRGEKVLVECRISRSGFASERIFRVEQTNRSEHIGAAPVHYCWTQDGTLLTARLPAENDKIPGLVQGYVISNGGLVAKIETPDGEVVEVMTSVVKRDRDLPALEPYHHVPIGS